MPIDPKVFIRDVFARFGWGDVAEWLEPTPGSYHGKSYRGALGTAESGFSCSYNLLGDQRLVQVSHRIGKGQTVSAGVTFDGADVTGLKKVVQSEGLGGTHSLPAIAKMETGYRDLAAGHSRLLAELYQGRIQGLSDSLSETSLGFETPLLRRPAAGDKGLITSITSSPLRKVMLNGRETDKVVATLTGMTDGILESRPILTLSGPAAGRFARMEQGAIAMFLAHRPEAVTTEGKLFEAVGEALRQEAVLVDGPTSSWLSKIFKWGDEALKPRAGLVGGVTLGVFALTFVSFHLLFRSPDTSPVGAENMVG